MYWFLGILGVIVAIFFVLYKIQRTKREAEVKRREEEWRARIEAEEKRKAKAEAERRARVPVIHLNYEELPFELDTKQIIYIENEYDEAVNNFIVANYNDICKHFESRGYEFCYLPLLSSELNIEIRKYYNPTCNDNRNIEIKSNFLLDYLESQSDRTSIKPSLLYVEEKFSYYYHKTVVTVYGAKIGDLAKCDKSLSNILRLIAGPEYTSDYSYSLNRDDFGGGGEFSPFVLYPHFKEADEWFDNESRQLMWEIRERIERLQVKGISKYLLEQAIFEQPKLSRLVVTHDYRILLPDYNNMEIVMTPIVKAVYILFLSHDEGIPFKSLADYRKELLGIYLTIKGENEPTEEILKSIRAITDPFNNSINEKCARIREAFVSQFDEEIAKHYFVTGKRGEPKRITLSRDLVEWE